MSELDYIYIFLIIFGLLSYFFVRFIEKREAKIKK